jgi:predicted MFS family arabinose efflux permease
MNFYKDKNIRALFGSVFLSSIGNWIFQISILIYIFNDSKSATMISAFILTSALPALIFSPLLVRYISRFSNKTVLVAADIVRAILIAAMIFLHESIIAIFIINAFVGLVSVAFNSAYVKQVSVLFSREIRHKVNAILNSGNHMATIIGSLAGASLVINFSIELCLLINSLSFIFSAALLYSLNNLTSGDKEESDNEDQESLLKMMLKVKAELGRSTILSSVIIFGLSWGVIGGAYTVLLPVIFMSQENSPELLSGFYTVQAIALIFGSIIVYSIKLNEENIRLFRIYIIAYLLQAVFFSFSLFTPVWSLVFVSISMMRLCSGVIISLDTTLIQNNCSNITLPFIYSAHGLIYKTCYQFSVIMAGIMIDTLSIETTKLVIGWSAIIVISTISLVALSWSYKQSATSNKEGLKNG